MTKPLLQILDASIFPATLMIAAKFIGLYITIELFSLDWGIENAPNNLLSSRPVLYADDVVLVSTNSDLFLLFVMILGFSFYVAKATFFHDTHVDPKLASRLAVNGLLNLVSSSYEIYRHTTTWLIFTWITNITIFINVLNDKTEYWVSLLGIAATLFLTVVLLRDVVFEVRNFRQNIGKDSKV
ncbi:hypothetical protein GF389_02390 [Candidatus Dojkabacteria bacterium]|nr:hypothetical protein [Candidatus Dojkabacteria bacterium]